MKKLIVPQERLFGWVLKDKSSVYFGRAKNKSGQMCVILEHSLLRGVTTEMIAWWFENFPNLEVKLDDIEGYENQKVPAYLLWHPSDHISAHLTGELGPNNTAQAGVKIHIKETMQYKKYGLKYPVDNALKVFYCENDGWAMGKQVPFLGKMMQLRISFKDVYEEGQFIGVHYHYEVVAGTNKKNPLAKFVNRKIVGQYDADFWDAWITHNTIEVGVFENFLPALYAQRDDLENLHYSKSMNPITEELSKQTQTGFDKKLFEERLKGFEKSTNAFEFQRGEEQSFL